MSEINLADEPLAPPPRVEVGEDLPTLQGNLRGMVNYIHRIYKKLELDGRFATTGNTTGLPDDFDEGETVEPSEATITTAQTTANLALTNANAAASLAAANDVRLDAIAALAVLTQTISNPPTTAEVTAVQDKVNEIINAA